MSGQRTHGGGKDATGEGFGYRNGALRSGSHGPPLKQSEFYVAIPELRMHLSCCAFSAVE